MLQKIQTNSVIFKYLTRSHTSSYKVRLLVRNAFASPYFQLIYTVWPLPSVTNKERIETSNRQIYCLLYNYWYDTHNTEVKHFPTFQTITIRAQKLLRRFFDQQAKHDCYLDRLTASVTRAFFLSLATALFRHWCM